MYKWIKFISSTRGGQFNVGQQMGQFLDYGGGAGRGGEGEGAASKVLRVGTTDGFPLIRFNQPGMNFVFH